jgi:methionyl-tRNA formyltransferase
MIKVHASLLPMYRGAAPIQHAIVDGRTETGVTIMRVVKALDAGPMLASVRRAIDPDETGSDLERDLAQLGASLLVDVVDRLAAGPVDEEPQDERFVTCASRLTKQDGALHWTASAQDIHNRVRGLHPWRHAYASLNGERVIVLRTALGSVLAGRRPARCSMPTATAFEWPRAMGRSSSVSCRSRAAGR